MSSGNGNLRIAKVLIQVGLDVYESQHVELYSYWAGYCICFQLGYTSLHWAAEKGELRLADFLLKNGSKIEARDTVTATFYKKASHRLNNLINILIVWKDAVSRGLYVQTNKSS